MKTQSPHQQSTIGAAASAALPEISPHQTLYTVEQFAQTEPAFTSAALRCLIFKAESRQSTKGTITGNGLIECGAVIRSGRKVMIHRANFLAWVQA
jgi:hypothetical protein